MHYHAAWHCMCYLPVASFELESQEDRVDYRAVTKEKYSFGALADAAGFMAVYPQGLSPLSRVS